MAIAKIKASMTEPIKKSHKNQHGGYMYAGIDDIYAALTKKMGEVGLVIFALEDEKPEIIRVEKDGKTSQWAKFCFGFILATPEAQWSDPRLRRSLFLQIVGPQTFQAAQSYAEKSFMKSVFSLSCGDAELDGMPQADTEEDQVALNTIGKTKRKSSSSAKANGDYEKVYRPLSIAIEATQGAIECRDVWVENAVALATMPRRWFDLVSEQYVQRMGDFGVDVEVPDQQNILGGTG